MVSKISVLKDFEKLTGKELCWVLILIKLQTEKCLKIHKKTSVPESHISYSWNLQKYAKCLIKLLAEIFRNIIENICAGVLYLR